MRINVRRFCAHRVIESKAMKTYRGPRTTKKWAVTDTKSLTKWAEDWHPGKQLHLDGTIQKHGQRHTDFGIEFEADDIAALHDAFQRFQKKRIAELEAREANLSETADLLEAAFNRLHNLLSFHRDEAPSPEALLEAVQKIAEHFAASYRRKRPLKLDWIDWDSV